MGGRLASGQPEILRDLNIIKRVGHVFKKSNR